MQGNFPWGWGEDGLGGQLGQEITERADWGTPEPIKGTVADVCVCSVAWAKQWAKVQSHAGWRPQVSRALARGLVSTLQGN